MIEYIEEMKKQDCENRIFGFKIDEFEIDRYSYGWTKSRRNYLHNGSLLDECLTSNMPLSDDGDIEEYSGRTADKVRYCVGDLVEVLHFNTVTLEIVGALPFSPEEVSERKIRLGNNFSFDYSDDCYYTQPVSDDCRDHSHPAPNNLFPARFPVSDELRKNLEARNERYLKDC
jgi:hypothetical protein